MATKSGGVEVNRREIPIRARATRGQRLLDAIQAAYAAKYTTPASLHYVRGFARRRRSATTTELLPIRE